MKSEQDPSLLALGRAIRQAREQKGSGVDELAETAEVSQECIQALEAGSLDPTYELLRKIADGLGVTTSSLIVQVEQSLARKDA